MTTKYAAYQEAGHSGAIVCGLGATEAKAREDADCALAPGEACDWTTARITAAAYAEIEERGWDPRRAELGTDGVFHHVEEQDPAEAGAEDGETWAQEAVAEEIQNVRAFGRDARRVTAPSPTAWDANLINAMGCAWVCRAAGEAGDDVSQPAVRDWLRAYSAAAQDAAVACLDDYYAEPCDDCGGTGTLDHDPSDGGCSTQACHCVSTGDTMTTTRECQQCGETYDERDGNYVELIGYTGEVEGHANGNFGHCCPACCDAHARTGGGAHHEDCDCGWRASDATPCTDCGGSGERAGQGDYGWEEGPCHCVSGR